MPPKRVKIRGERGRWVAQVEGRWLPVIHQTLRTGTTYKDSYIGQNRHTARYAELMEAFQRETRVVLQKDKPGGFERAGYIGVFDFSGFQTAEDGGFSLEIVSRYADPL